MDKQWIFKLADDVQARHGKEACDRLFGDIDSISSDHMSKSAWFERFTTGMDELDDKEFLQQMMAKHCPCGREDEEDGKAMKEFYDNNKTLEEFVDAFRKWINKKYNGDVDIMELRSNLLFLTKPLKKSRNAGSCGKGCHCSLAKHTEKLVSDIFCYCCTIGHTGRMFKVAFGEDIKMEFIESIIYGGKGCTMTVYLPEKDDG